MRAKDEKTISAEPINDGSGEVMAVELYYSKDARRRGYYMTVQPETRKDGSRSFVLFSGERELVKETNRFNQKEFDALTPDPARIAALSEKVMEKRRQATRDRETEIAVTDRQDAAA